MFFDAIEKATMQKIMPQYDQFKYLKDREIDNIKLTNNLMR